MDGLFGFSTSQELRFIGEVLVIGPLMILDKSFIQMLKPAEIDELSLHFMFVGTPTLVREIIADLKKEGGPALPEDMVRALARKMGRAHGVQPANFRDMALSNLFGSPIPMFGQVPVDSRAPGVTASGEMLLIDSTSEQRMWERWAEGRFAVDDEEAATAWRESIQRIDLRAVGNRWKEFAAEHFSPARDLTEMVGKVDVLLADTQPDVQLQMLDMTLTLLRANQGARNHVFNRFLASTGATVQSFAPYACSILRLYLTFVGGLARGFLGPRPSHFVDLQYLFYAPFCMAFVSADKFHRQMWPAASGINSFIWGDDMKVDLMGRIKQRAELLQEDYARLQQDAGLHPVTSGNSTISELWKTYMLPKHALPNRDSSNPHTIADLEPEIQEQLRRAMKIFDGSPDQ
jgi:hypothetical protein